MSFLLLTLLFLRSMQQSSSVPLYMWNVPTNTSEYGPALASTTPDSMKRVFSKHDRIVAFIEDSLRPEDFSAESFPEMSSKNGTGEAVAYRPRVESPMEALLGQEAKVRFVHLDGARGGETRKEMLKRHDKEIARIYRRFSDSLGVYTALKRFEKASTPSRRTKRQQKSGFLYSSDRVLMHLSGKGIAKMGHKAAALHLEDFATTGSTALEENSIAFDLNSKATQSKFTFNFRGNNRNWKLASVKYFDEKSPDGILLKLREAMDDVPVGYSYVCETLFLGDRRANLTLAGLQMQPFFQGRHSGRFGPAMYCTGYTSIPILTGLITAFLMLGAALIGVGMIMDIKTNRRFDGVTSKPLFDVVNAHRGAPHGDHK